MIGKLPGCSGPHCNCGAFRGDDRFRIETLTNLYNNAGARAERLEAALREIAAMNVSCRRKKDDETCAQCIAEAALKPASAIDSK